MHHFLCNWLRDGSEMWLHGHWNDLALAHLFDLVEFWRPRSRPTLYHVSGQGIRVCDRTALQAVTVSIGTN